MKIKFMVIGALVTVLLFSIFGCTHTSDVIGSDGEVLELEIRQMRPVEINGTRQWIYESGLSRDNPILLWLDGGPGGTELGWVRTYLGELHEYFTVVCWDQRGVAKSSGALGDYDEVSVETFVADVIALSERLSREYGGRKIYLVGHSWGSIIGLKAAHQAPELFAAYIGAAQQINSIENDTLSFQTIREEAQRRGDSKVVRQLDEIGLPPYGFFDDQGMWHGDGDAYFSILSQIYSYSPHGPAEAGFNSLKMFTSPEHTLKDRILTVKALVSGTKKIYPQLAFLDFEKEISKLEVPVFLVNGRYDRTCPPEIARRWFRTLEAPLKDMITLEGSGHNAVFCEPDAFIAYMRQIPGMIGDHDNYDKTGDYTDRPVFFPDI
jgi:pimeloyl-ACP methyl ester carboxylesterase